MSCAIVLAAGESRRMGAPKMLLPFGKTTVIGHVVDQLLKSVIDEVYVVAGHQASRVTEELSGRPVSVVINPDYRAGMLSSVRCGLRALRPACEPILVALGDQPAITSSLIDRLAQAFTATDRGIVVPLYRGQRGHPLLFSQRYCKQILTRYDDVGLRGLLYAHPDDVLEYRVSTPAVLSDIDDPEDYRRELDSHRRKAKRKHPPPGQ